MTIAAIAQPTRVRFAAILLTKTFRHAKLAAGTESTKGCWMHRHMINTFRH